MIVFILGIILYLADIFISLAISILIIKSLYISKKFNKQNHFHFYNDLFSWELFFIFVCISNLLLIIASFYSMNFFISNFLLKISILIMYNNFWSKIIHTEKFMNIITYERHYYASIIPLVMVVFLFILNLEVSILISIFLATSLLPFLFISIFLRNTEITREKSLKICLGTIFFGTSLFLNPIMLNNFDTYIQIPNLMIVLMYILAPLSLIIGTLLVFETFWKEIF